jgi:hypothetical protein
MILQVYSHLKQNKMKKINSLVFPNAAISDLSAIQGGNHVLYFIEERTYAYAGKVTWWPVKFPVKYELHKLDNFNAEHIK